MAGQPEKSTSSSAASDEWSKIIELLILQIERVASHFGYTEEYVLSHTPAWLSRKFEQMQQEQWERHQLNVIENFKGLLLVLDMAFNKGKDQDKILPPSREAAMQQVERKEQHNLQYVQSMWWK